VWLADRLQGKAHSLLVNLEDEQLDSWDCLVSAMNAQFNVTQDSAAARQDLMTRKQGKGETVADFINGLQLLARRAYANNLPKRQEVIMDRLRDGPPRCVVYLMPVRRRQYHCPFWNCSTA